MFTRSTRTLLILLVGIALLTTGLPAAGVAFAEAADQRGPSIDRGTPTDRGASADRGAPGDHDGGPIGSTGDAFDRSSGTTLSVASATVPCIVLLAGYVPSDGTDPLEHDLREELHDAICESPVTAVSDLRETADVHRSTLRYHLDVLEREELVASGLLFGQRWYYPAEGELDEVHAALDNDVTGEIVDGIARLEPVSVTALASEVERSPSTVSYHLERLEDEGVIERERHSATVLSQLAPDVRAELEGGEDPADSA